MFDQRLRSLSQVFILGNLLSAIVISPALAETELLKTLTVTGNGMESIATTIAEVRLGVEIQGKTVTEVQEEVAKRSSAIVDLLRSENAKKLRTTGVRLNPNYERGDLNNSQRSIVGYTGTNIVSFQISKELVGSLLDETVAAGASRIDGISFMATDEAKEAAREEALRKASINAQDKADIVFEALNLESNEIVNIKVDRAYINQPQSFARDQFSASESRAITPIIGGEQMVEADVTLQISY